MSIRYLDPGRNHLHCASYGPDTAFNSQIKKRAHIFRMELYVSFFPYISIEQKFKVYESAGVARIYIVALLLKDFHVCPYGNQIMNNFASWNLHRTNVR